MARKHYIRIRKRLFVVTGLILLAVLLAGGLLAIYASTLVGPFDMIRLNVVEGQSRTAVLGSGISLDQSEPANLLQDASFEPLVFRQTLTIYSGDATTLTVSSEDASAGQYGDGFFDGSAARVMTQSAEGLSLKKTARVEHYGINRVGVFQSVKLPGDLPAGQSVLAFVRRGELSLAVGEKGLIIRNVTGQMPEIAESGITADLTGICSIGQGFLACSSGGDLLSSADGQDWQLWPTSSTEALRAVAASDLELYVAVGDGGTIVAGRSGTGTIVKAQTAVDLTDIAYGSSTFVAIGAEGTILISKTGLLWQTILLPRLSDWQAIDYRDGRFVLVGSGGAIAISDDGRNFQMLDSQSQTDFIDLVMLSRQQLIALDRSGYFFISNDGGASWLQSNIETGLKSQVIAMAGKDKILSAAASGGLGLAQLVAEIQLDSPLKEGQFQSGDLIFLEKTATEVPDSYLAADTSQQSFQDPWQLFGSGFRQRVTDDVSPGGGISAMKLKTVASQTAQPAEAILSQVVKPELIASDKQNEVYRIELWMKQSDVTDRSVQAWLTGPFQSVGTTFTNVGANWKKFSYSFILPPRTGSLENHEIRFNIAIVSGTLWLDQASISRATDNASQHSSSFQTEIETISPQFIRLDFARIGSQTTRQESWANALGNDSPYLSAKGWTSQSGTSLQAALKLVQTSGADPWLVIDSYASEASLLNLMEFLAGPISEPYGKIRQDLGEVIPWTDRFGRILIEFADSGGIFRSDRLKADFVDLMIRTVSQSPYYRQIKSKLVFIDGMTYSDGVMLSSADYHATDLNGLILPDPVQALQNTFLDYYDRIPRNPEKAVQNWPELMRTARLRANGTKLPNLADLTEIMLHDLGKQTSLSNLNLPSRTSLDWQATWPAAAAIASACARGVPLAINGTTDAITSYGFITGTQVSIVLINLSAKPATCQLLTDLPIQKGRLSKYDAKGKLISEQVLKNNDSRLTVLPGGVVLIVKAAQ